MKLVFLKIILRSKKIWKGYEYNFIFLQICLEKFKKKF